MSGEYLLANSVLKRSFAYGVLLLVGGPLPVWIGSRQNIPVPDPGADRSVPSLVVDNLQPPETSERFAP